MIITEITLFAAAATVTVSLLKSRPSLKLGVGAKINLKLTQRKRDDSCCCSKIGDGDDDDDDDLRRFLDEIQNDALTTYRSC